MDKQRRGAWSIPKGLVRTDESDLDGAMREFREETGQSIQGELDSLGSTRLPDGKKVIHAWAVRGDIDATAVKSNMFSLEWPRGSGIRREYPEVDRPSGSRLILRDARSTEPKRFFSIGYSL